MKEFLKVFGMCLLLGIGGFLWFASAATTVDHPPPASVSGNFQLALAQFEDPTPLLTMDGSGNVTRHRRQDSRLVPATAVDVVILAWQGPEIGLVETRLPLWLLGLKGPALRYLLRDTNFDPARWGITVSEIKDAGPAVLIDHHARGGRRILVWSE